MHIIWFDANKLGCTWENTAIEYIGPVIEINDTIATNLLRIVYHNKYYTVGLHVKHIYIISISKENVVWIEVYTDNYGVKLRCNSYKEWLWTKKQYNEIGRILHENNMV